MSKSRCVVSTIVVTLILRLCGTAEAEYSSYGTVGHYELNNSSARLVFTIAGYSNSSFGCTNGGQFAIHTENESYSKFLVYLWRLNWLKKI